MMGDRASCCREPDQLRGSPSPFDGIIALGWYDGVTEGLAHCGSCGREYRFDWLDASDEGGREIRIYRLAPLGPGSMERLTAVFAPGQEPRRPVWVPSWKFPSDAERSAVEGMTQEILDGAGPPELVLAASDDLGGAILGARSVSGLDFAGVDDWFAFLGLSRTHAGV